LPQIKRNKTCRTSCRPLAIYIRMYLAHAHALVGCMHASSATSIFNESKMEIFIIPSADFLSSGAPWVISCCTLLAGELLYLTLQLCHRSCQATDSLSCVALSSCASTNSELQCSYTMRCLCHRMRDCDYASLSQEEVSFS
jgi:hypothetical protein